MTGDSPVVSNFAVVGNVDCVKCRAILTLSYNLSKLRKQEKYVRFSGIVYHDCGRISLPCKSNHCYIIRQKPVQFREAYNLN